jgi:hypothetical protein
MSSDIFVRKIFDSTKMERPRSRKEGRKKSSLVEKANLNYKMGNNVKWKSKRSLSFPFMPIDFLNDFSKQSRKSFLLLKKARVF